VTAFVKIRNRDRDHETESLDDLESNPMSFQFVSKHNSTANTGTEAVAYWRGVVNWLEEKKAEIDTKLQSIEKKIVKYNKMHHSIKFKLKRANLYLLKHPAFALGNDIWLIEIVINLIRLKCEPNLYDFWEEFTCHEKVYLLETAKIDIWTKQQRSKYEDRENGSLVKVGKSFGHQKTIAQMV
jgi:hypothetical protein